MHLRSQRRTKTNNPMRAVMKQTQISLMETLMTLLKSVNPKTNKQSVNQRAAKKSRLEILKRRISKRKHISTMTTRRKRRQLLPMRIHTITRSVMMCVTCSFQPNKLIGAWCKEVLLIQCTKSKRKTVPKKVRNRKTVNMREEFRKLSFKFMTTPHSSISSLCLMRASIKLETSPWQPWSGSKLMIYLASKTR